MHMTDMSSMRSSRYIENNIGDHLKWDEVQKTSPGEGRSTESDVQFGSSGIPAEIILHPR